MAVCNSLELTRVEYRVLVAPGMCRVPLVELVRGDWFRSRPMASETDPGPTLPEVKRAWRRAFGKLVAHPDLAAFADLLDHGGYSFRYRDLGSDVGMLAQTMHAAVGLQIDDTVRERRGFLARLLDRVTVEECPFHGRSEVRRDCRRCSECPCMIPYPTNDDHPGRPRLFCSSRCRQRAYRRRMYGRSATMASDQ